MNRVTLTGRLTRDPEVKAVGDDNKVAKFGIAVDRNVKDKSDFFDVEVWGKTADIVEKFFSKGKFIIIDGRLQQDTWEKDGQKNSKVFVVAERVEFGPKTDGGGDGNASGGNAGSSGGGNRSRGSSVEDEEVLF